MIFGRRKKEKPKTRIFFATDVHGSDRCFRKWLNAAKALEADCLIMGGDITGKALVPVISNGNGWSATVAGQELAANDDQAKDKLLTRIRASGLYDVIVSHEQAERLNSDRVYREEAMWKAMRDTYARWVALADERLPQTGVPAYFILGNDDDIELLDATEPSPNLIYAEDGVHHLPGDLEMISCGFSTPTPWDTPRELSEEDLADKLEDLAAQVERPERAIFNLHCPPRDTHLDQAPLLDSDLRPKVGAGGLVMQSVGSSAVRDLIERHKPLLGLHGHVHESTATQKIGETVCINPGSDYQHGILRSVVIDVTEDGIGQWQLMQA